MPNINRTIDELLADYAAALRDGCIPIFLKSLTRKEASQIASSEEFRDAAQMARVLNGVAFAGKATIPTNVSRFIQHVNAEIVSQMKKPKAMLPRRSSLVSRTTGHRSRATGGGRAI
jgi:hypothetical protein